MSGGKGGRPEMRTSGFQRPFHPLQVLSWGVFGLDVLLYAVFGLPLVATKAAKVAVSVTYAASVAVLVAAAAFATAKNPADPFVLLKDEPEELERVDTENNPYCVTCDVPVRPRSKHCRECNKCVDVFDHHCMWLNNCIGAKNYAAFFTTICAVAVMVGIVLSTCGYLLVDYFSGACILEDRIREVSVFDPLPKGFFLGLLIVLVVVNFPLFVLDVQLIFLHLFLMSQQLTTYEYIMNKQGRLEMPGQDEKAPPKSGAARLGRGIRTLPRCLDWIVFARCCRKRRPRRSPKDDAIQRISQQEEPSPRGGDVEVGLGTEPASPASAASAPEALKRELPAKAVASPPGSTVDAGDSPGAHSEAQTPTPLERERTDGTAEAPPSPAKGAPSCQDDDAETNPEAGSNSPATVVLQRTATPEEVRCAAAVSSPRGLEVVGKHSSAASSTRGRRERSRGTASARRRREVSCDDGADSCSARSPVAEDERRSRRTSNRPRGGLPTNTDSSAVPPPPADAEQSELPQAQNLE